MDIITQCVLAFLMRNNGVKMTTAFTEIRLGICPYNQGVRTFHQQQGQKQEIFNREIRFFKIGPEDGCIEARIFGMKQNSWVFIQTIPGYLIRVNQQITLRGQVPNPSGLPPNLSRKSYDQQKEIINSLQSKNIFVESQPGGSNGFEKIERLEIK